MRTYYDILGIAPQATQAEVRQAYRRLAAQLHPDANPSPQAAQRFVLVNEAHDVLSDPLRRATYDYELATQLPAAVRAAQARGAQHSPRRRKPLTWRQRYGGLVLLGSIIVVVFVSIRMLSRSIIAPAPRLDLSYRGISVWPEALTHTREIKYLNLAHNELLVLPANINSLPALEMLNLNNNQLSTLPDNLYSLSRLSGLHLAGNKLHHISPRIAQLRELRMLNLAHNQLRSLPQEIEKLPELVQLNVTGNPIPAAALQALRRRLPKRVQLLY